MKRLLTLVLSLLTFVSILNSTTFASEKDPGEYSINSIASEFADEPLEIKFVELEDGQAYIEFSVIDVNSRLRQSGTHIANSL